MLKVMCSRSEKFLYKSPCYALGQLDVCCWYYLTNDDMKPPELW